MALSFLVNLICAMCFAVMLQGSLRRRHTTARNRRTFRIQSFILLK
jgi:hypothetical protein